MYNKRSLRFPAPRRDLGWWILTRSIALQTLAACRILLVTLLASSATSKYIMYIMCTGTTHLHFTVSTCIAFSRFGHDGISASDLSGRPLQCGNGLMYLAKSRMRAFLKAFKQPIDSKTRPSPFLGPGARYLTLMHRPDLVLSISGYRTLIRDASHSNMGFAYAPELL